MGKKYLTTVKRILIRPPSIKFVKRAKMWLTTTWDEKGQHQQWSNDKPNDL